MEKARTSLGAGEATRFGQVPVSFGPYVVTRELRAESHLGCFKDKDPHRSIFSPIFDFVTNGESTAPLAFLTAQMAP